MVVQALLGQEQDYGSLGGPTKSCRFSQQNVDQLGCWVIRYRGTRYLEENYGVLRHDGGPQETAAVAGAGRLLDPDHPEAIESTHW